MPPRTKPKTPPKKQAVPIRDEILACLNRIAAERDILRDLINDAADVLKACDELNDFIERISERI